LQVFQTEASNFYGQIFVCYFSYTPCMLHASPMSPINLAFDYHSDTCARLLIKLFRRVRPTLSHAPKCPNVVVP